MLVNFFNIVSPVLFVDLIVLWWVRAMRFIIWNEAVFFFLFGHFLLLVILRSIINIDLSFFLLKVSLDTEACLGPFNVLSTTLLVAFIRGYIVDKSDNFLSFLDLLFYLLFLNLQFFLKLFLFEIVCPGRKQPVLEHFIEDWRFLLVLLLDFQFFLQKYILNIFALQFLQLLFQSRVGRRRAFESLKLLFVLW